MTGNMNESAGYELTGALAELRVPPSRRQGADPAKLARQIALFGRSKTGMPPP